MTQHRTEPILQGRAGETDIERRAGQTQVCVARTYEVAYAALNLLCPALRAVLPPQMSFTLTLREHTLNYAFFFTLNLIFKHKSKASVASTLKHTLNA